MVFKRQIAGAWNKELLQGIPKLEGPARTKISDIWDKQVKALTKNLITEFPEGEEYITERFASLSSIKAEVADLVGKALLDISKTSAKVHPALAEYMMKRWEPGFKRAMEAKRESFYTTANQNSCVDNLQPAEGS